MRRAFFYGWVIVATLFVVNFATHATGNMNLGLFVIPMSDEIGISRGLFGWLTTSRTLAAGLASIVIGRLVDRFGARILIPASALITGLGVIAIGSATNVVQLFVLFAVIGFGGLSPQGGGLLTSVPVAKWFVRKRGTAMAVTSMGLALGATTFVPVTQFLIGAVGWRRAWLYLGIISMTMIVPTALTFLRRQPEDMGLRPDGDADSRLGSGAAQRSEAADEAVWTLGTALSTRAFWMLTAALALGGFAAGGGVHRIPYWIDSGFDHDLVSLSISVHAASAATVMLAVGILLDRVPARFVAAGPFAGFSIAIVIMLSADSNTDMFASAVIWGMSAGTGIVSQPYLWASYFGRSFLGTIRGVTMPTILVATSLGAPAMGYVFDFRGSYDLAWQVVVAIYAAAFLIMVSVSPLRLGRPLAD